MTCRLSVGACVTVALLSMPGVATAQRHAFVRGIAELVDATEGIYGDEGSRVVLALDVMSRALDAWDREIATLERQVAASETMPAQARVEATLALARMYAERGRPGHALARLEEVAGVESRPRVQVLRGLLLEATGNLDGAAGAFRRAWADAPSVPTVAYHVWRASAATRDVQTAGDARAALAAMYQALLRDEQRTEGARFQPIAPLEEAAGGLPLLPLAAYRVGFEQLARGELHSAIDEIRRAASTDALVTGTPGRSASVVRALASLRQGHLAEARALLEQPGTLDDSPEARRILGLVYWAASEFDKSIAQFESAIRLSSGDERSRLALARALSAAGREEDARGVLGDAMRVIPASARAHWWLATSYERVNRFADARHEFDQAATKAVAGRSHLLGTIGRLASGAADGSGAVDALTRAVGDDLNNPAWHRLLAGALLLQDRPEDALAEFIAAVIADPRDPDAHLGVGQIYLDAGRNAEAVPALRRATELKPDSIEAEYALATALTRLGDDREATRHFEHVEQVQRQRLEDRRRTLSLDSLREEAALRAREHDHDRAAALWRQAIQRDPRRAADHAGLADALAGAGRLDAAILEYERAAALGADPIVYRRLADLLARAGRAADAARARMRYEAALRGGSALP